MIKKNGEIKMNLKAYNGRCVAEWLAHSLKSAASQPTKYEDERLPLAALCMSLDSYCSVRRLFECSRLQDDAILGSFFVTSPVQQIYTTYAYIYVYIFIDI